MLVSSEEEETTYSASLYHSQSRGNTQHHESHQCKMHEIIVFTVLQMSYFEQQYFAGHFDLQLRKWIQRKECGMNGKRKACSVSLSVSKIQ